MEKHKNIFVQKQASETSESQQMSADKIKELIPPNCLPKPDLQLQQIKTEWRWRFYKIDSKIIVEMSYKEINSDRLYLNKNGEWITGDINTINSYAKYIVKELYYYSDD